MKQFFTLALMLIGSGIFSQVAFKVELLSDQTTYQVSIRSDETWPGPLGTVSTAQVSLTVPTGGFVVGNVMSINGLWNNNTNVSAPSENPNTDYIIFGLQGATSSITFQTGTETPLFTFENTGDCTGALELLENDSDPFFPPNSQNVNVGNQMSVIGAGVGVNAYTGNFETGSADCENPGNGGGGNGSGNPSPEGEDAGNCDDITISDVFEMSPSMCGIADGAIFIVASTTNGLALQFSIDGGTNWQAGPQFDGLAAGDFFEILVRDVAGICTEEWGVLELDAPLAAVVISQTPTNPSCMMEDGSIEIVAESENNEPIEFSFDNATTWQSSGLITGLAPGNYRTYVRNLTTGCEQFINEYALVEDCGGGGGPSNCLVTYHLDKLPGDVYQMSITPEETWTFPNNITSSMQVTFKVTAGNFDPTGSLVSLVPNIAWQVNSIYKTPVEDPNHDYFSIGLASPGTSDITFSAGQKTPLFTFENFGDCTGGEIFFMDNETDPFFPPNSQNANVGQQMTVVGGGTDLPICIQLSSVLDCPAGPCDPDIQNVDLADLTGCGTADGTITISASATLTLQYSVDGGSTWQSDNVFTGLTAGDYNIMVMAGAGCQMAYANNPVTLGEPNGMSVLTPIPDQTSCGGVNVQVSIEVNEAVMAFNVEGTGDFGNTMIDGNTAIFDAIPTGNTSTFEVEIMGSSGCSVIETFTMDIIDLPQTTYAAPINGCKNSEIEINYLGNAGPMASLDWSLGTGQILNSSPANSSQPEGATIRVSYPDAGMQNIELTVTANGCDDSSSSMIEIRDIDTNIDDTITDATGCGSPTGSVSLILDGSANYNFVWDNGGTDKSIADLIPGDYTLTITNDDNGCSEEFIYTVGGNTDPPDVIDVSLVQPLCDGTLASFVFNNPPTDATFDWTTDNSTSPADAPSVDNLEPGNYSVTVTDNSSGCTAETSFEVTAAEAPTVAIDETINIDCSGNTGAVTFSVGGSLTFDYELTLNGLSQTSGTIDGGNAETLDNLPVGNYILTVTNPQNGCEDTADFPIFSTNNINVIAVGIPPSGCNISDAQITLELNGNNPPFVISSDVGNVVSDTIISNGTITGLYDEDVTVTIIDAVGCELNILVPLPDLVVPQLSPDSVDVTHAKCPDDISAGIAAANGTSLYMVTDSTGQLVGMTPVFALPPGVYTVTHQLGDCDAQLEVTIQGPDAWDVQIETVPATCEGNDGAIYVTASGANGGLMLNWSNGSTSDSLENLAGNEFFDLIITDSEGCVFEALDVTSDSDCGVNSPCDEIFSESVISQMIDDSATTEVCLPNIVNLSSYLHILNDTFYQPQLGMCSSINQSIMINSEPGQYVFTVMDIITQCQDSVIINLLDDGIPDVDTIHVEVFETQSTTACLDASELSGAISSLTNVCEDLSNVNALTSFNSQPIIHDDLCISITGETIGQDIMCMVLCDNSGLCDTTIVVINVVPRELIIYSGMSPNNDGVNDHFTIKNIELYPDNHLEIYTRWGTQVFEIDGYRNDHGWYGTFESSDLPDGTYFYMLDDGEGEMYSGYLQLQR